MTREDSHPVAADQVAAGDAEAIRYLRESIGGGRHWYLSLLGAIGLWTSASEKYNDHLYIYLIDGEAFDWLLLAERLSMTVDGLVPETERDALLFHGVPPLKLTAAEIRELIGDRKYGQYLNYFYGITIEEALLLAVQEEVEKERHVLGMGRRGDATDETFLRLYDTSREELLKQFRLEKGYPQTQSTTIAEMKVFTYWLFKYRLKKSEKAKIASDTKKALKYLKKQWQKLGVSNVLAADFTTEELI
jgi:hypothetical protein